MSASYLDLHIEIENGGRLKTKLFEKRNDFTFPIINFPFISSNSPSVWSLHFTTQTLFCTSNTIDKARLLTQKRPKQCPFTPWLKSSLQKILRSTSLTG